MAKDPAFLFYPGDWLGGTLGMTFEEKGAYMELLMMQFTRGHMTDHMIAQTVGQLWVKLQDKFIKDDAGLWYNERLDSEKEKRKNYVSSRKNNKKGSNQHNKTESEKVGHMTSHMENENENVIVFGIKRELHISVRKKYANDKPKLIYDIREYFAQQAEQFHKQGWTKFDDFMKDNPGRVFDDDDHVYNSFKKFHLTPNGNGQRKPNPGKL